MSSVKTTCIRHPSSERFLRIFPWQIELCEGNHCAAYLLSYFESWHNYKLQKQFENKRVNDIAENHGDKRTQDEHSLQFHSYEDFEFGLLGLYKKNSIRDALAQFAAIPIPNTRSIKRNIFNSTLK
jgi:hypothetical protein